MGSSAHILYYTVKFVVCFWWIRVNKTRDVWYIWGLWWNELYVGERSVLQSAPAQYAKDPQANVSVGLTQQDTVTFCVAFVYSHAAQKPRSLLLFSKFANRKNCYMCDWSEDCCIQIAVCKRQRFSWDPRAEGLMTICASCLRRARYLFTKDSSVDYITEIDWCKDPGLWNWCKCI